MTESSVRNQERRIELKYPVDADLAAKVRDWARERLGRDPHVAEADCDSYEVRSIYFDTAGLDLACRTGLVGRTKFRIRQYNDESNLWLESKRKRGDVVRKSRTVVDVNSLTHRLAATVSPDAPLPDAWCGDWFVDRIRRLGLQPTASMNYRRFARTSLLDGQQMRLTIDSDLRAEPTTQVLPGHLALSEFQAVTEAHILELKFNDAMPWLFKELLQAFPVASGGFSKYRTAMLWLGRVPAFAPCG